MTDIIKPEDRHFVVVDNVDPYFSPRRNAETIDKVIKKYEKQRALRTKEYQDQLGERVDAVKSYLFSNAANSNKPIEKYISRHELAHLQGKKIIEKLERGYRVLDSADNYA